MKNAAREVMKNATRVRRLAVCAGLAIVVGSAIAVAGALGASASAPPAPAAEVSSPALPASVALATTVQPDQSAGFSVLARRRTASDEMPPDAEAQVGNGRQTGRNVDLSRAISTPTGTGWVIPGNGTICLAVPDPVDGYGIACDKTQDALSRGVLDMLISSKTPDVARVTLLVPAQSAVTATMTDGQRTLLAADAAGVVSATLTGAQQITVTTDAGTKTIALPVPPPVAPRAG